MDHIIIDGRIERTTSTFMLVELQLNDKINSAYTIDINRFKCYIPRRPV